MAQEVDHRVSQAVQSCNAGPESEHHKMALVLETHTGSREEAVMVPLQHTAVTYRTMVSSGWPLTLTQHAGLPGPVRVHHLLSMLHQLSIYHLIHLHHVHGGVTWQAPLVTPHRFDTIHGDGVAPRISTTS